VAGKRRAQLGGRVPARDVSTCNGSAAQAPQLPGNGTWRTAARGRHVERRFAPIEGQYAVFRMTYRGDGGWA
jgi:hypothetical protein